MECKYEWGDIIQVPRSALSPNLAKCYGDMFGVVVSARRVWHDGRPPHYVVALISKKWESPKLEVEITTPGSRFAGWAIVPTLLVNVRQCQLAEITEVDRKRGKLSDKDQDKLWICLYGLMLPYIWYNRRPPIRMRIVRGEGIPRPPIWFWVLALILVFLGAAAGAIGMHFFYPEVVSNLLGCPTPPTPGPY